MRTDPPNLEEKQAKAVFAVDFDGPIAQLASNPLNIADIPLKKYVFEMLTDNGCVCVLGSQRITYATSDLAQLDQEMEALQQNKLQLLEQYDLLEKESPNIKTNDKTNLWNEIKTKNLEIESILAKKREFTLLTQMNTALDQAFGFERTFFKLDHMKKMGTQLQEVKDTTGKSKSVILDKAANLPECKDVLKKNIYLIDDMPDYRKEIESNNYQFIDATSGFATPAENRKYLAEMLICGIKDHQKIYAQIKSSSLDLETKKEFADVVAQCFQEKYKSHIDKKFGNLSPEQQQKIHELILKCEARTVTLRIAKLQNPMESEKAIKKAEKETAIMTITKALQDYRVGILTLGEAQDFISKQANHLGEPGMLHPTRTLAHQVGSIMTHVMQEVIRAPEMSVRQEQRAAPTKKA